jgi:hypothetical protein
MAWSLVKPQGLFHAQQQTRRVAARGTVWRRCAALLRFFVSRKRCGETDAHDAGVIECR